MRTLLPPTSNSSRHSYLSGLAKMPLFLGFLVLAFGLAGAAQEPSASQRYLEDIKSLTTPAMEGRGDGTKGLSRAANWIEQRYKSLGLEPGAKQSFLQPFTVITGAQLKSGNAFHVHDGQTQTTLKLTEDFIPFSFSSSGTVSGPVVFAGYGASASEFNYDDFAGLDVKDKIVVLLRYEPPG